MKKSKNIEKPLFIKYAQQKSRKAAPRLCLRGFYAMIAPGIPPTAGRNTEQDKGTEAMTTLRKNDLIDIDITGMTAQGAGVGHWEGMAVFTPLTAPGDRARVRVVKVAKSYAFGRLEELLSPSPDRVEPDCPCFAQCGGCCYRHIRYEAELNIKEARVRDALERIGGFSGLPMRPILGAPSRDGYRNKALLPLGVKKDGSLSMGFYAVNSHRIVDCQRCLLQPEEFNRAMEAFRQWAAAYGDPVYDEGSHSGKMRRLYLRMGEQSGQVLACVVVNGNGLHHEQELVEQLKAAVPGLASVVKVPHHLRDRHHRGQTVRAAVPALPPLLLPGEPGAGGASIRLGGGIRPAHRGGAAAGFILRRGDHWALPGGEGPAAAGGGNHPGGGGECPGKRQTQRH